MCDSYTEGAIDGWKTTSSELGRQGESLDTGQHCGQLGAKQGAHYGAYKPRSAADEGEESDQEDDEGGAVG